MTDVRVIRNRIGAERETFKGRMEVRYAVLGEEADEVEATDGVFAFRWRQDRATWPRVKARDRQYTEMGPNL